MAAVSREKICEVLEEIALLLEMREENPFKVRAYRTGAETVRSFAGDIIALAAARELKGVKGIGDALQDKLHELATTGRLEFYEKLRAEFPPGIFELFELQGLGPKKVSALYKQLGVASVADLKQAIAEGKVAALAGFGEKTQAKLLEAISYRETNAGVYRVDQAAVPAGAILDALRGHPDVTRAEVAGSFRRGKEIVRDLDFLVETRQPEEVMEFFARLPMVQEVIAKGKTKTSVHLENGLQCDLRAVTNQEYPFALAYFTGSKEHNIQLRSRALTKGWTLNEYRLAPSEADGPPGPEGINEEADLHRALGLDYIAPELREAQGEIEAAAEGKLPRLVEMDNLRGTFHNHTTASDGANSLAEMAAAARELGLAYLGIADHSKSSFQANGLDEVRLLAQVETIRQLNKDWDDFCLFAGSEVDILKDGTLDFADDVLAELDYVVASVHSVFTLDEAAMTKRIIRAVENPHVTMLGHLTGRLLLKREPYAVNIAAVIEACAETGTIIELNCSPWRLDLDWRWWKFARDKGVRCSINPDAHETAGLQDLWHGVRAARKGWLRREDVINCLTTQEVRQFLAAKRTR